MADLNEITHSIPDYLNVYFYEVIGGNFAGRKVHSFDLVVGNTMHCLGSENQRTVVAFDDLHSYILLPEHLKYVRSMVVDMTEFKSRVTIDMISKAMYEATKSERSE